jgi:MFS family permease
MPNWQLHRFITLSVLGAAVAAALMVIAPNIIWFLFAAPIFGVSAGLAMTAAYTAAGHRLPESSQGVGFGVLSSGSMAGMALSPILSGAMGTVSLEAVFIVNTVALVGLSFFARRNVGTVY